MLAALRNLLTSDALILENRDAGQACEMGVGSNQLGATRSRGRVNDRVSHGQVRIQARFGGQSCHGNIERYFPFVESEGMRQKKFRQSLALFAKNFLVDFINNNSWKKNVVRVL